MTDDNGELEVLDLYDPEAECRAWKKKPGVIGAPQHTHRCRQFPDHQPPHVCWSCGATWSNVGAVAA